MASASSYPGHNTALMLEIAGRPLWWFFLTLIPLVNLVVFIVLRFDLAKRFGKGNAFGFGLLFLGFVFLPILAFDRSRYRPRESSLHPSQGSGGAEAGKLHAE